MAKWGFTAVASIIELALLAVALLVYVFYTWRFWGKNVSGWLYFVFFCTLQIIGDVLMAINLQHEQEPETFKNLLLASVILMSVAIAPLLYGMRLLAMKDSHLQGRWTLEWTAESITIALGSALAIAGYIKYVHNQEYETGSPLVLVGAVLYLIAAIMICVFACIELKSVSGSIFSRNVTLLSATALSLPFLTVRIVYFIVSAVTMDGLRYPKYDMNSSNPLLWGGQNGHLVLTVAMDLIIASIYIVAGALNPHQTTCSQMDEDGSDVLPLTNSNVDKAT